MLTTYMYSMDMDYYEYSKIPNRYLLFLLSGVV